MAADVAAVMDAAGIDSAHVHGLSMGGLIAQELALSYPERVRSLILSCTSCGGREAVPAEREASIALRPDPTLSREESLRRRVPFIYVRRRRVRVEDDIARRLATPYIQGRCRSGDSRLGGSFRG
jgi:pimeloyl-ACP methyl ester carboxylesterase